MHSLEDILLALTPMERWKATQQLHTHSGATYWLMLGTGAVLVLLVLLLVAVSLRRRAESRKLKQQESAVDATQPPATEHATRPASVDGRARRGGLTTRENQILLAIAVRSGAHRSQDIFSSAEAFDQGAEQLLAECLGTRTPEEREQLNGEVSNLRKKLGLPAFRPEKSPAAKYSSSRSIPVGVRLELMHPGQETGIEGEVVRNDDIELAIEFAMSLESRPAEPWHVRCYFGMSVWEFDTTAVSGEGGRLILNHSDAVRRANRRRFPRVTVNSPALVAHLPFLREDAALREEVSLGAAATAEGPEAEALAAGAPTFVQARVTELAGPGLRLETSLQVEIEDMILVVFALAESGQGGQHRGRRTLAAAGRVKHCQPMEHGTSIAVELSGLNDDETEELVLATREIAARAGATSTEAAAPRMMAAT